MGVLTILDIVLKIKKTPLFSYVSFSIDFHSSFTKDKMILACISWILAFFHHYQKIHFILLSLIGVKYSQNISWGFLAFVFFKGKKKVTQENIYLCWIISLRHTIHQFLKLYSYLDIFISNCFKQVKRSSRFSQIKSFALGIWQKCSLFLTIF